MSTLRRETEPLVIDGRLYRGLLTFDHAGRIVEIALIVDGLLVERDNVMQRTVADIDDRTRELLRGPVRPELALGELLLAWREAVR